jgi:hypothetical protein
MKTVDAERSRTVIEESDCVCPKKNCSNKFSFRYNVDEKRIVKGSIFAYYVLSQCPECGENFKVNVHTFC